MCLGYLQQREVMTSLHVCVVIICLVTWTGVTGQQCDPTRCVLPNCRCYNDTDPPGNLQLKDIPQIIAVTMADSLSADNYPLYSDLFNEVLNPNGCPIRGTFYLQLSGSELPFVRSLWKDGFEVGINSLDGTTPVSSTDWVNMLKDAKSELNQLGIDTDNVLGVRAPQMALDGTDEFIGIGVNKMLYDSSCSLTEFSSNMTYKWPFTYDVTPGPPCDSGQVPDKPFPGKWEVPVADLHDLTADKTPCTVPSACQGIQTKQDAFELFHSAFLEHYNGNRTPFMLVADPTWVSEKMFRDGTVEFLQYVRAAYGDDVWILPVLKTLQWIQSPTPIANLTSFQPWSCS